MRNAEVKAAATLVGESPTPAGRAAEAPDSAPRAPRAASSAPLLLFEQVSKWYGTVLALNQVTLALTGWSASACATAPTASSAVTRRACASA